MENQEQFETVYNDIKDVVKGLAESLQVGAEHVYEVLVRQQVVISISWTLLFAFIIILIIIWKNTMLKHFLRKIEESKYDKADYWVGIVVSTIVLILLLLPPLFHIDVIITGFVNPEYGAIKEIMELVK